MDAVVVEGANAFRTTDVDEVRDLVKAHFYANSMDVLRGSPPLSAEFAVQSAGAVTVGDLFCGADVRLRVGELGSYHVNLPLSGRFEWRQGRALELQVPKGSAAVFQPVGDTVVERWAFDCRLVALKIDQSFLEHVLERMIEGPVRGTVRLSRVLDVTTGPGRSWSWLARMLGDEVRNPTGLFDNPLIGPRLREDLVRGLLLATDHQYRDRLMAEQRSRTTPATIRRAVDAIHDEPETPFTVDLLARTAGISVRALQDGFRRYRGVSPMTYLREVRLARVHDELREAAPGTTSVAEVASRWGFAHLGRFAAGYQAKYAVLPSETLRG